jgi:hypothetical protein
MRWYPPPPPTCSTSQSGRDPPGTDKNLILATLRISTYFFCYPGWIICLTNSFLDPCVQHVKITCISALNYIFLPVRPHPRPEPVCIILGVQILCGRGSWRSSVTSPPPPPPSPSPSPSHRPTIKPSPPSCRPWFLLTPPPLGSPYSHTQWNPFTLSQSWSS